MRSSVVALPATRPLAKSRYQRKACLAWRIHLHLQHWSQVSTTNLHGRKHMARVTRRKFLKVSGAGALAAKTGGMAGILATGTGARLRAGDHRALAALERLRAGLRPAAAQGAAAGGREGARHQDQLRDGQRQRPAAAHHRRHPVGRRPRPHHALQQPPAALCREPCRPERRRRGDRQGRGRLLSPRQGELATTARSGSPCRGPSSAA